MNFSIGGAGGGEKLPKARALPEGTIAKIASCSVEESKFDRTIRSGSRAGQKEKTIQLKVIYEVEQAGTTIAYRTSPPGGAPVEVPARQFAVGDRFVQYLGGVYPKDNGGFTFTKTGSSFVFVEALESAGVPPTGDLAAYVGLYVTIVHSKGRGPAGPYVQAMPGKVVKASEAVADPVAATKAPATSTSTASKNAFEALSADDQKTVLEALAAGPVTATELKDSGFATSIEHAEAILATVPTAAPKKSLLKKAN